MSTSMQHDGSNASQHNRSSQALRSLLDSVAQNKSDSMSGLMLSKIPERKARRSSQSLIRHSPLRINSRRCVSKAKPAGPISTNRRSVERENERSEKLFEIEERKHRAPFSSPTNMASGTMFSNKLKGKGATKGSMERAAPDVKSPSTDIMKIRTNEL